MTLFFNKNQWIAKGILLVALLGVLSCRSSDDAIGSMASGTVKINLLGSEEESEGIEKLSLSEMYETQQKIIPIGDQVITATLTPKHLPGKALRQTVSSPLPNGTKYKVVVYNKSTGAYFTEKDFTVGQSDPGLFLDGNGGTTYTFVAYSIGSLQSVPAVTGKTNISTSKLSAITTDLMYFKTDLTVYAGNDPKNQLDIILKHRFSEITTKLDAGKYGTLYAYGTNFSPVSASADLSFSTGALTYGSNLTNGAPVTFTDSGNGVQTSSPTALISPGTTNAALNFGVLALNGEGQENVKIEGLNLSPGTKYNLNVNVKGVCRETVQIGGFESSSNGYTEKRLFARGGFPRVEIYMYEGNTESVGIYIYIYIQRVNQLNQWGLIFI